MILVDEAIWSWRDRRWAHLVSDSSRLELLGFGLHLGLRAGQFQGDHFDVTAEQRDQAIAAGAAPVTGRDLVRRVRAAGLRSTPAQRRERSRPLLLLVNGPPAAGKSTLARRYVDDRPLALLVEIDALPHEDRLAARRHALAVAEAHLATGRPAVIPQYVGRRPFVDELASVADRAGARFVHLHLLDDEPALADRFRRRRRTLAGTPHPESTVADADVETTVAEALVRLAAIRQAHPRVRVVDTTAGEVGAYAAMLDAIEP